MNPSPNPGCKAYSENGVTLEAGFYTRGELEQMILMIEYLGRMYPVNNAPPVNASHE
jgi:hypothetical protein